MTIGHSDHSIPTFVELLKDYGIEYFWLGEELGGYRKGGYKRHLQTKLFKNGIRQLLEIFQQKGTCMMCMETNPSTATEDSFHNV